MREWYRAKTLERGEPAIGNRDPVAAARSEAKRSGSPLRRASLNLSGERMRERYPEKYKARNAVGNAIRKGTLARQPCETCSGKAEAHHPDYSRPLDVVWLCRSHHKQLHKEL